MSSSYDGEFFDSDSPVFNYRLDEVRREGFI